MCGKPGRRQGSRCDISQIPCRNDDCVFPPSPITAVPCVPLALLEIIIMGATVGSLCLAEQAAVGSMLLTGVKLTLPAAIGAHRLYACPFRQSRASNSIIIFAGVEAGSLKPKRHQRPHGYDPPWSIM